MDKEQRERYKEEERRELMATVLFEAAFSSDTEVAERYDITEKTVRNYRLKVESDPLLKGALATKWEAFNKEWAGQFPVVLREAMETIKTVSRNIRKSPTFKDNPGALKEVAAAAEVVAKIYLTNRAIDARLPGRHRPDGGQVDGEGAESGDSSAVN